MSAPTAVTVSLPIEIPIQRLRDLLCSAVEGGSNYWAKFVSVERTPDLDYVAVRVIEHEAHSDAPAVDRILRAEDLAEGLAKLGTDPKPFTSARRHLADFLAENDDATTADVVLQCTLFGDVIYG